MEHESMAVDVLIVGAGPSGLASAIRLKQLCQERGQDLTVCILEKGSTVGAHILSGAVLQPCALNELLPNWQEQDPPPHTAVTHDEFYWLTKHKAVRLPTPSPMHNTGNYLVSLSQVCRWLGTIAEQMGVDIFPGFAGQTVLFDDNHRVIGIQTGDMGVNKHHKPKNTFQPGMNIYAKQVIFAEGARGHLSEQLIKQFQLRHPQQVQTYGLGIKEIWRISASHHQLGKVIHTVGWPLANDTYGGSFLYHMANQQIAVGFVVGLDYRNPYLSPFHEMQRFKLHPKFKPLFENGERLYYGARALTEGGFQAIPKLTFPGGVIVGCSAGFMNVPKIKGSHTAMKSGMLAAEAIFTALQTEPKPAAIRHYQTAVENSSIWQELYRARNIRPSFKWGLIPGLVYAAIDTYLFRGQAPWTFSHHADHTQLLKASAAKPIEYPKPDGKITFDRLSSLYLTGVQHEEDQPSHLKILNASAPIDINYRLYDAPEQRYCPAGVYEILTHADDKPYLHINAQNCIHCKTCDIKDPTQNIRWIAPEGGGGPNYTEM